VASPFPSRCYSCSRPLWESRARRRCDLLTLKAMPKPVAAIKEPTLRELNAQWSKQTLTINADEDDADTLNIYNAARQFYDAEMALNAAREQRDEYEKAVRQAIAEDFRARYSAEREGGGRSHNRDAASLHGIGTRGICMLQSPSQLVDAPSIHWLHPRCRRRCTTVASHAVTFSSTALAARCRCCSVAPCCCVVLRCCHRRRRHVVGLQAACDRVAVMKKHAAMSVLNPSVKQKKARGARAHQDRHAGQRRGED